MTITLVVIELDSFILKVPLDGEPLSGLPDEAYSKAMYFWFVSICGTSVSIKLVGEPSACCQTNPVRLLNQSRARRCQTIVYFRARNAI